MSRKYKNPPISEAICAFQFGQDSSWDFTVPGLVYEKVQTIFPKRSQIARVTVGILPDGEEIAQQLVPVMRFSSEDEKVLMQVGADFLSVNHLKPYSSWKTFLSLIQESFKVYLDVAKPESIQRIGLRYINTIDVQHKNINLEDYFEFRPYIGSRLPRTIGPFMMSVQLPYENLRDVLNLRLISVAGISTEFATIILDLDYFTLQPKEVKLDDVFTWIETAHLHVEEAFEASITDQLRQLFEG